MPFTCLAEGCNKTFKSSQRFSEHWIRHTDPHLNFQSAQLHSDNDLDKDDSENETYREMNVDDSLPDDMTECSAPNYEPPD